MTGVRLEWSPWIPLREASRVAVRDAGLYRVRRVGRDDLDYIGQTGKGTMNLRKRLGMLASGTYASEMPYRDPHTAAPSLWALRHRDGCEFECATAIVVGERPYRQAVEALAIARYRQEHRRSPTVNFGRMPEGYVRSTPNNARLVAAGTRSRGGPSTVRDDSHEPSIAPMGSLDRHPTLDDWYGLEWSRWFAIDEAPSENVAGLYRIRRPAAPELLYIGESARIGTRLPAHRAKARDSKHRQAILFGGDVECSWAEGPTRPHQREELEADLIGSHLLVVGTVPSAQFLG